jgi:TolA-binding protein
MRNRHLPRGKHDAMTWLEDSPGIPFLMAYIRDANGNFDKRIDQVGQRIDQVDKRIDQVDKRIDRLEATVEKRFDDVGKRFDSFDKRFESLENKVSGLSHKVYAASFAAALLSTIGAAGLSNLDKIAAFASPATHQVAP